MTTIFYTQDVPGEREWIKQQYPYLDLRETFSSNKWIDLNQNSAIEIPFVDNNIDLKKILKDVKISQKIKLVYDQIRDPNSEFNDISWTETEKLCINDKIKFTNQTNQKIDSYILFTFGRCGSTFLESILGQHLTPVRIHYVLDNDINEKIKLVESDNVLIVFLYRKNWWDWIVSSSIAHKFGYFHYDSDVDWNDLEPFKITEEMIQLLHQQQSMVFNFWCNLRLKFPQRKVNLYTFEGIIPYNQCKTKHRKINYDHKNFIRNYDEAKEYFEKHHLEKWKKIENAALSHLSRMGVIALEGEISLK